MIHDARRHNHEFCKSSRSTIIPAGNAQDLAVIAQIYFTSATGSTLPTRDRRVKCNAVPLRQTFHVVSEGHNCSRRLMAHNDGWNAPPGRAIVAVNIAAADTAGRDAHKNFTRTRLRHREIRKFKMTVL